VLSIAGAGDSPITDSGCGGGNFFFGQPAKTKVENIRIVKKDLLTDTFKLIPFKNSKIE